MGKEVYPTLLQVYMSTELGFVLGILRLEIKLLSGSQWEFNLKPIDLEFNTVSFQPHAPDYLVSLLFQGDYWPGLPPVVFGCMSVAGGLMVLHLPETKGRDLPETLEDGEAMVREHRVCGSMPKW